MARTPLMRYVIRSLREARAAAAAGIPADEFAALRRDALSRRDALRRGAAVAGAALLAGCAGTGGANGRGRGSGGGRVVIVGAGVAGLHCASILASRGVVAEIYEASNRVGGRMFTDRKTFGTQSCELGAELIDTDHETMRGLAEQMGLPLLDFQEDDAALAPWLAHIAGRRMTEAEVLEGFAPVAAKVDEALATLADPEAGVTWDAPNGGEALDAFSIRQWLDGAGVEGPVRALLDVAYTTEYGLETDISNALNFLLMISTDLEKFAVFGDSDERFRLKDGNDAIIRGLHEGLGEGQVRLGHVLTAARRAADGRVLLTFDRGGASVDVAADRVVFALPFSILREVALNLDLSPVKTRAIAEIGYGTNAKLMVGFSERVWRKQGSNGEVFTDLPFQCSWETSRLQPGAAGIITNFTGGAHGAAQGKGTTEERTAEFLAGFDRVFPGAAAAHDGRAVRVHWPSFRWTRGAYSSYLVGQYTAFCGAEIAAEGNVHFCGEHTSTDYQGFMEGGALTGLIAGDQVLTAMGIPVFGASLGRPGGRGIARARLARRRAAMAGALAAR